MRSSRNHLLQAGVVPIELLRARRLILSALRLVAGDRQLAETAAHLRSTLIEIEAEMW